MTTAMSRLRAITLVALVPLAAALTACGPIAASSSAPPTASPPSTPAPGVGGQPSTPAPATPPTSGTVARSRCTAGHLRITVAPGNSAAGHIGLRIVFTNTSAHTCTIYGYPGVSFLTGPTGAQINDPAMRSAAQGEPTTVVLAPNGKAHADLLLTNVDNFPANACKPTQAAGVRVYPPDDTKALYAAAPLRVCTVHGTGLAQIYPVRAGAGSS